MPLREALEVAHGQKARWLELRAAVGSRPHLEQPGTQDRGNPSACPIHAWFTEGFALPDLVEAEALLVDLGIRSIRPFVSTNLI